MLKAPVWALKEVGFTLGSPTDFLRHLAEVTLSVPSALQPAIVR